MRRRRLFILLLAAVLVAAGGWFWRWSQKDRVTPAENTSLQTSKTPTTNNTPAVQRPTFNKSEYSLTDPASLWVIVNKQHPIDPSSYVPADLALPNVSVRVPGAQEMKLRQAAAGALEQMFGDAKSQQGLQLQITTAYRSYLYQKTLYDGYVKTQGQAAADQSSARPGYSEHQTGWAVDIRPTSGRCYLEACFGDLPEGQWLAANAYKYGFILRYPADKQAVTGYEYEPWHFHYVGVDLATEMHNTSVETLEEFFGVSGGTTYN